MGNVERMKMVKRIGLNPLNVVKGDLNLIPQTTTGETE
tara:strand:- start:83 stop:196 length:114 start_codon:yes stop_codon:yes gene_type:complete